MTSIEWLMKDLLEKGIISKYDYENMPSFDEAKEMHKQEIIEAYCNGNDLIGAEQYYQETFKK